MPERIPFGEVPREVVREYRDTIARRLWELRADLGSEHALQVLENLRDHPLFRLSADHRRDVLDTVSDPFLAQRLTDVIFPPSENDPEGIIRSLVAGEGAEGIREKLPERVGEVRESLAAADRVSRERVAEERERVARERERLAAERATKDRERQSAVDELTALAGVLGASGYASQPELERLRDYVDQFPQVLRETIRGHVEATEGLRGLLGRSQRAETVRNAIDAYRGSLRAHTIDRAVETDAIDRQLEALATVPEDLERQAWRTAYSEALRPRIERRLEGLTALPLVAELGRELDHLAHVDRFTTQLLATTNEVRTNIEGHGTLETVAQETVKVQGDAEKTVGTVEERLSKLEELAQKQTSIDERFAATQHPDEVRALLAEERKVSNTQENHRREIGRLRHALVELCGKLSGTVGREATVAALREARAELERLMTAFDRLSRELFGVPLAELQDRHSDMLTVHQELTIGLGERLRTTMNAEIERVTAGVEALPIRGAGDRLPAAYDLTLLKEFSTRKGRSAVVFRLRHSGAVGRESDGGSYLLGPHISDIPLNGPLPYGSITERLQGRFPPQALLQLFVGEWDHWRRFTELAITERDNGRELIWMPIPLEVDRAALSSALARYAHLSRATMEVQDPNDSRRKGTETIWLDATITP